MPEEVMTFFFVLEIDLAAGYITETVVRSRDRLVGRIERLRGPNAAPEFDTPVA